MDYSDFIRKALDGVSEIANRNFGKVTGTTKEEDNNQVLTATDLEIGKRLIAMIEDEYPEFNVIDEEAGVIDKGAELTWVVDPIDGTSNFANGVPTYGIMLGLLKGNQPIAGGIALPYFKEVYVAERGNGTWCNGQRTYVSEEVELKKILMAYQIDGHQEDPERTRKESRLLAEVLLRIRNLRTSNSAFDAAMVSSGHYGAMVNQTSKIWDNVAQQIVIEEAGGMYTDFWGEQMIYENPLSLVKKNFTYCAAAPKLHDQIQEVIRAYG